MALAKREIFPHRIGYSILISKYFAHDRAKRTINIGASSTWKSCSATLQFYRRYTLRSLRCSLFIIVECLNQISITHVAMSIYRVELIIYLKVVSRFCSPCLYYHAFIPLLSHFPMLSHFPGHQEEQADRKDLIQVTNFLQCAAGPRRTAWRDVNMVWYPKRNPGQPYLTTVRTVSKEKRALGVSACQQRDMT